MLSNLDMPLAFITEDFPPNSPPQERIRLVELLVSSQCPEQADVLAEASIEQIVAYLRASFPVSIACCVATGDGLASCSP